LSQFLLILVEQEQVSAQVYIRGVGQWKRVSGRLYLHQTTADGPVIIRGSIQGLSHGLHGLHIHESGNLADDCKAAGPHLNPFKVS